MKNRPLIILISIVSLAIIVLLGIRFNIGDNAKKLKADITYPTSNGFAISCDSSTINLNDEAICTLVGHYDGGLSGLEGIFVPSSGIEVVTVTLDSAFINLNALSGENNPLAVDIATFSKNDFLYECVTNSEHDFEFE